MKCAQTAGIISNISFKIYKYTLDIYITKYSSYGGFYYSLIKYKVGILGGIGLKFVK